MKQRYLEVTFRKGKPFAAYLYLPRTSVRVDLDANDAPMGIEITAPAAVTAADLNAVLVRHGLAALDDEEWAPLAA